MAIYFAKDFLLLVVLISFFAAFRRKEVTIFRPPFLMPLLIFIWFGGMQIFNPASTSVAYGLMGFKIFFYYVPLMFVGYALLNSEAELRRFFTINLVLVLIIVSLGIAQSIIGPSFLNPAVQAEDLRLLSGLYRVSDGRRYRLPANLGIRQRRPLRGFHHGGLDPGPGIQRLPAAPP